MTNWRKGLLAIAAAAMLGVLGACEYYGPYDHPRHSRYFYSTHDRWDRGHYRYDRWDWDQPRYIYREYGYGPYTRYHRGTPGVWNGHWH